LGNEASCAASLLARCSIFKKVSFDKGWVITNWGFDSSEDTAPSRQDCYYTVSINDGVSSRYEIAEGGVMVSAPPGLPIDQYQAFANCVWSGNPSKRGRAY
jgi:hypothetical protein